jgi:hypothetical protein
MSLRKLGGVAVERLGGACRVVLVCLTGRGLAFSFASPARLRALTVVPVLSLRALGLSFVVVIMVVDVVVLRTDRFLVGVSVLNLSRRGPSRFLPFSGVVGRVNHKSTEPYFVFEIAPIHNIMPIFSHNTFLLAPIQLR